MRPLRKSAQRVINQSRQARLQWGVARCWALGSPNDPAFTVSPTPPSLLPKACWEQPGFCPGTFSSWLPLSVAEGEGPEALTQSLQSAAVWELDRDGGREGESQGELQARGHACSNGPQTLSPAHSCLFVWYLLSQ